MIPLLRRLWTATEISHDGPYYPMQDVKIHPGPTQPGGPPIIVAGRKGPAMRRAARMGDGWFPYLYSPRRYAERVTAIKERPRSRSRPRRIPLVRMGIPGISIQMGPSPVMKPPDAGWNLQPRLRRHDRPVAAAARSRR